MKAVILARVSTEEQKDAGNSLPAQITRMERYCVSSGFDIVENFSFDESAYGKNRSEFDQVVEFIENQNEKVAVCFDKVDRLSRNVFDKRVAQLYEKALEDKIELHFVSEGQVINSQMSAPDKFRFGMSLGLAKYYSDAISDNVKRAFEQKRRNGEITGTAPFGYKSVYLNKEKRLRKNVIPDSERAPIVVEIFERYISENTSARKLARDLNDRGVMTQYGRNISQSHIHSILKNRFYYGESYSPKYDTLRNHPYETLISKETWDKVREIRERRNKNPQKSIKKNDFIFAGILGACPECGCSMTPEYKKDKKYVYYSCTNAKGICKREYINEEQLLKSVRKVLKSIRLSDSQVQRIVSFLKEHHSYQAKYHKQQLKALRGKYDVLQVQADRLLDLFIDGKVAENEYEKKLRDIKGKQQKINIELESYTEADESYHITAKTVLSLAQRAEELFESSEVVEKRQLISFVFQNLSIKEKRLDYSLRSPFDVISDVNNTSLLRRQDSNL